MFEAFINALSALFPDSALLLIGGGLLTAFVKKIYEMRDRVRKIDQESVDALMQLWKGDNVQNKHFLIEQILHRKLGFYTPYSIIEQFLKHPDPTYMFQLYEGAKGGLEKCSLELKSRIQSKYKSAKSYRRRKSVRYFICSTLGMAAPYSVYLASKNDLTASLVTSTILANSLVYAILLIGIGVIALYETSYYEDAEKLQAELAKIKQSKEEAVDREGGEVEGADIESTPSVV